MNSTAAPFSPKNLVHTDSVVCQAPLRILQLCKKFPYPLKDGESLAVTYLSRALHDLGCHITLLAMNTTKHYTELSQIPDTFNHYASIHTVEIDNFIRPLEALKNLFSKKSFHISRFESADYEKKLVELLQKNDYDIIQLETLYLTPYIATIRRYSSAKIVLRSHNVEFEIWERISHNTTNILKKIYLKHLAKKLKNYEISQLNQYDLLLPITHRDAMIFEKLGTKKPQKVIPIGLDINKYRDTDAIIPKAQLSMSFIGSLDWQPNIEGLMWFLDNIWNSVHETFPDLMFHVAGRNTPNWLRHKKCKNVIIYGEIPDAIHFIKQHDIMLVPLTSGGGMRAKILEGMALQRVVLTTTIGLEGIDARHQKEILLADTLSEIINNLQFCYGNPEKMIKIGQNAQALIANQYDNYAIAQTLINEYQHLMPVTKS